MWPNCKIDAEIDPTLCDHNVLDCGVCRVYLSAFFCLTVDTVCTMFTKILTSYDPV